jgi:hypothetical protein
MTFSLTAPWIDCTKRHNDFPSDLYDQKMGRLVKFMEKERLIVVITVSFRGRVRWVGSFKGGRPTTVKCVEFKKKISLRSRYNRSISGDETVSEMSISHERCGKRMVLYSTEKF